MPKPVGVGCIQLQVWQWQQIPYREQLAVEAALGRERLQPPWRDGIVRAERTNGRPAQRLEVAAASEPLAKIACDRANVGARATSDVDSHVDVLGLPLDIEQVDGVDGHGARAELDRFTAACQAVGWATAHLARRERWRHLLERSNERLQRVGDDGIGGERPAMLDRPLRVIGL